MPDKQPTGSLIELEESLYAGFLSYDYGAVKEFAAFELMEDVPTPLFKRICNPTEKKKLKKLVYGDRVVKSIRHRTAVEGDEIQIFHLRP